MRRRGDGQPEGNRLARAGLCGDDEVPAARFGFEDGGLHIGRLGIAALCKGGLQGVGEFGEIHIKTLASNARAADASCG